MARKLGLRQLYGLPRLVIMPRLHLNTADWLECLFNLHLEILGGSLPAIPNVWQRGTQAHIYFGQRWVPLLIDLVVVFLSIYGIEKQFRFYQILLHSVILRRHHNLLKIVLFQDWNLIWTNFVMVGYRCRKPLWQQWLDELNMFFVFKPAWILIHVHFTISQSTWLLQFLTLIHIRNRRVLKLIQIYRWLSQISSVLVSKKNTIINRKK